MKKVKLVFLVSFILILSNVFAQNNFDLGFRYGSLNYQDWDFQKGNIELNGGTKGRFLLGIYAQEEIKKNLLARVEFNYMGANEFVSFRFSGGAGGNVYSVFALTPTLIKDISIVPEKFGIRLGLGFSLNFINTETLEYIDDGSFHVIWKDVKDQNGNYQRVPAFDITLNGKRTVERPVSFYIRPEISLYYNLSDRLTVILTHLRGYNPGKPLISRSFDPIIYDHENFRASDYFVGNYRSTSVGIEYRLK